MIKNYAAIDIAKYVIKYASESGKPVTNLYLQKILYYLQLEYLLCKGYALYREDIIAWKYGPVVESVYDEFASFGSCTIESDFVKNTVVNIDSDTKRIIELVVDEKMKKPSWKLVSNTCNEAPWLKATNNGKCFNKVISLDMLKEL